MPEPSAITKPFALAAGARAPRMEVPESAGQLVITLPTSAGIESTLGAAPEKVAFTSQILQDSLLQPGRKIECWVEGDALPPAIARIPITGSAPAPKPTPDAGAPTAPAVAAPDLPVTAPPADASAGAPQPSVVITDPPIVATAVDAPVPPSTVRSGTFIPTWVLLICGVTLVVLLTGFGIWQQTRLVATRRAQSVAAAP